jgi:hypothetical protein
MACRADWYARPKFRASRGREGSTEDALQFNPVLATWDIRSKIGTSRRRKISFPCLQTQEGWCTIRSRDFHPPAQTTILLRDGEASCMTGVLTHLRRLKDSYLEALTSRIARWSKPLRTSLPLATLADLSRSKHAGEKVIALPVLGGLHHDYRWAA